MLGACLWYIGELINREILGNQRAEYGKQIVAQVARQLQREYGEKGFDKSHAVYLSLNASAPNHVYLLNSLKSSQS